MDSTVDCNEFFVPTFSEFQTHSFEEFDKRIHDLIIEWFTAYFYANGKFRLPSPNTHLSNTMYRINVTHDEKLGGKFSKITYLNFRIDQSRNFNIYRARAMNMMNNPWDSMKMPDHFMNVAIGFSHSAFRNDPPIEFGYCTISENEGKLDIQIKYDNWIMKFPNTDPKMFLNSINE